MAARAVALIPGFLGFDHRRGTTYFADRFVTGLRTRLEARCGAPFPVVPVSTLPVGSLADRQEHLLGDLRKLDPKLDSPQWHLLGHSTGGVDAALLARTHRLERGPNGSVFSKERSNVQNLASVTTVSAPHYGTGLARSPFGMLIRGQVTLAGMRDGAKLLRAAILQRDNRMSRVAFVLPSVTHSSQFYRRLFDNVLAKDLDPKVVEALTRTNNRRSDVPITSFATFAPPPPGDGAPDALFALLWHWTHDGDAGAEPAPGPFHFSKEDVVSSSPELPALDAGSNDAIVNTVRQVDEHGAFGGLFVGDHADVLGRYRRVDLLDEELLDPGLLTSGAEFDDDQFFMVLDRIADAIARHATCDKGGTGELHAVA
jgi:pimeloyl-ACP methyl ester carboxylesterase